MSVEDRISPTADKSGLEEGLSGEEKDRDGTNSEKSDTGSGQNHVQDQLSDNDIGNNSNGDAVLNAKPDGSDTRSQFELQPVSSSAALRKLQKTLSTVGTNSSRLDERRSQLRREKEDLEKRNQELEAKNEQMTKVIERLQSEIKFLEQAVEDADDQLKQVNELLKLQIDLP
ncbi:hypothetical protein BJX63DRAFT_437578 [Aspergillus granulosus]|uniref:Uncharacterized protein n=1 Tax=Aspergillus granulosus TaxID=176169 RepID=A0ABR4GUZ6_9EURO